MNVNVHSICPDCTKERLNFFQQNLELNLKIIEIHLKQNQPVLFQALYQDEGGGRGEHMWASVKYLSHENKTIRGILENSPVFLKDFEEGGLVEGNFDEIENITISEEVLKPMAEKVSEEKFKTMMDKIVSMISAMPDKEPKVLVESQVNAISKELELTEDESALLLFQAIYASQPFWK